jgi:lysozyme family protein
VAEREGGIRIDFMVQALSASRVMVVVAAQARWVFKMKFTPELSAEYEELWDTARVRNEHMGLVEKQVEKLLRGERFYRDIESELGLPWEVMGSIHSLETGLRFDRHLHNGDSLSARTTHVPKGRPPTGEPPFAWRVSAIDALTSQGVKNIHTWDIPHTLFFLEAYNGFGYRLSHPEVKSPYLWSMTNYYLRGKYAADGKWSSRLVSAQVGAVALLKSLGFMGSQTAEYLGAV